MISRSKRNADVSQWTYSRWCFLALRYCGINSLLWQSCCLPHFPELLESNQYHSRFAEQQKLTQLGHSARLCFRRLPQGTIQKLTSDLYFELWLTGDYAPNQTSEDSLYRSLYEGAILHEKADDTLLEMIRTQNHVYIEWKTNLQFLMKQDFHRTNSCDFSLGKNQANQINASNWHQQFIQQAKKSFSCKRSLWLSLKTVHFWSGSILSKSNPCSLSVRIDWILHAFCQDYVHAARWIDWTLAPWILAKRWSMFNNCHWR